MADFGGQLALGLMSNIVGQLTYFYTDKVGLAVGSVGIVMAIAKVIDALTDVILEISLTILKAVTGNIISGCFGWRFRRH